MHKVAFAMKVGGIVPSTTKPLAAHVVTAIIIASANMVSFECGPPNHAANEALHQFNSSFFVFQAASTLERGSSRPLKKESTDSPSRGWSTLLLEKVRNC